MAMTSRELVFQTLNFQNPPRAPRQLWTLPIATKTYPRELAAIERDFPPDLQGIAGHWRQPPATRGVLYEIGEYVDEWGCTFVNIQSGIHGEVKQPLVRDWTTDCGKIHIPREWLTIDHAAVNHDCAATDKFTLAGWYPRPFEQLQFIRTTEQLYLDLMDRPTAFLDFLQEMHLFYTEVLATWAKTDVDGLFFMDDWGAQRSLLIAPEMWREYFKPMYGDYVRIAHAAGKKIFMHSDGYILDIYPDLVEIGIDAVNSQIFCMGVEKLKPFAGRITFWGEIDRQYLLPHAVPADIDRAVRDLHAALWYQGGCIAQCEFGPDAKPENVRQVFASWDALR